MRKRLRNDLHAVIDAGYKFYWNKTQDEKDYIYHLLWISQEKQLPEGIARDYILPNLENPVTANQLTRDGVQQLFTVKKTINEKNWEIQFRIPADFPFKPPKFTLNGLSSSQLKNVGNRINTDGKVFELLMNIDRSFYNQWSPAFRLAHCIEFIQVAIDIHNNLPYKSNFLLLAEK